MGENAELWSYPDEESRRRTLLCWLHSHRVDFDESLDTESLRQIYIAVECGSYKKFK